jgi:chromosome segregation ATPase
MVTTDISQLSSECNTWRQQLRSHRDEFTHLTHDLQHAAAGQTSKDLLKHVEHYYNQFQIQLGNIHDLKQAIKTHHRKLSTGLSLIPANESLYAKHEELFDQYQHLDHHLRELKHDFHHFMEKVAVTT